MTIFPPSSTKIHIFAWSASHWSAHVLSICLYRRNGKYMHIYLSITGISSTFPNTEIVSKSRAHSQLCYFSSNQLHIHYQLYISTDLHTRSSSFSLMVLHLRPIQMGFSFRKHIQVPREENTISGHQQFSTCLDLARHPWVFLNIRFQINHLFFCFYSVNFFFFFKYWFIIEDNVPY